MSDNKVITFKIDNEDTKANVMKHAHDEVIPWDNLTESIILEPLGKDTKGTYGQVYKITNIDGFKENVVVKVIKADNI